MLIPNLFPITFDKNSQLTKVGRFTDGSQHMQISILN